MGTALIAPGDRLIAIVKKVRSLCGNIDAHRREIAKLLIEAKAGDKPLYKLTHVSFGAFVRDTLGISRQRAYQLINYLEVSTIVDTESQARELAGFSPEVQLAAIEEVGENKTAAALRAALQKHDANATRDAEKDAASSRQRREPRDIWDTLEKREAWFYKIIDRNFADVATQAKYHVQALIQTLRSSAN